MLIDVHVHLLPPRRLAGLLRWMHRFYAGHPIPVDVTLDRVIEDYARLGADYAFNLVYPIEPGETEELIRFNADLRRRHPWIIPWGSLHPDNPDKARIVERSVREHDVLGIGAWSERIMFGETARRFVQRFRPLP